MTQVAVGFRTDTPTHGVPVADPAEPSLEPNTMQRASAQVDLTEADASSAPRTWSGSRLRPFVRPIAYFALSRLVVLAATLAATSRVPRLHLFRALTSGWDGSWYLLIAQHGYPHRIVNENYGSRWAFFPAYPALIRATVDVTGLSYAQSAFVLSIALGVTAVVAVWLAVREVFGPVVADRSVLLFVFFPASFVLSMAYTEALFITAAGLCLFAISRRWWITASMCAVLGSLTRSFGLVLIACVALAAIREVLRERKFRPLLALALAPLGLVAWLAYSKWMTGTPFAFLKAEKFWGDSHFVWFTTPIRALLTVLTDPRSWGDAQVVLCAAAVVFVFIRRCPAGPGPG